MKTLPIDFLKECFNLDLITGTLIWRLRPVEHFKAPAAQRTFNTRNAGKPCGSKRPDGYLDVSLGGKLYLAHRVVFAIHFGYWPESIDHLNGDKADNRPSNLRDCTHAQNMKNQGGRRDAPKGAYFNKRLRRWQSSICVNYRQIHLGTFDTAEEAHAAYADASKKHNGAFANPG